MRKVLRPLAVTAGIVLILVGVPLLMTPLPFGAAAIGLGALLIIASSSRVRRFIRAKRGRHPKLDKGLNHVEENMPGRARDTLERTRPDRD